MARKTKIDWCDATWNPVTGCLHGCKYCYAERIANRFCGSLQRTFSSNSFEVNGEWLHVVNTPAKKCIEGNGSGKLIPAPYPFVFDPTFYEYKLKEPQTWKRPKTIFVCSMADLFGDWVPNEWIKRVFDACEKAPWHRYIFLTKNPKRLMMMAAAKDVEDGMKYREEDMEKIKEHIPLPMHDNWWFGSTIDNRKARRFQKYGYNSFVSIEPLTEYMDVGLGSFGTNEWVIIGAETGSRKDKVIPERKWVENIVEAARITRMKVFMKESIRELMGDDFIQEFPWDNE